MNSPKSETLRKYGYFVGPRDPNVNPGFPGKFMVSDPLDNEEGYAIVGDDLDDLVNEACEKLLGLPKEPHMTHWYAMLDTGELQDLGKHESFCGADEAAKGNAVWIFDRKALYAFVEVASRMLKDTE